jgi:hypothetical protein
MRGDVKALKRMNRQDRNADKSSQRLIKKLARTKRNTQRGPFVRVQACPWDDGDYDTRHSSTVCPNAEAALRRATLVREADGRGFLVGPIVDGLEDVIGILAIPKSPSATPETLARAVLKVPAPHPPTAAPRERFGRLSRRRMPLCSVVEGSAPLDTGPSSGRHLFVRRLHIRGGGVPLYYAQTERPEAENGEYVTPRELAIDTWLNKRLLSVATDVLGGELLVAPV